MFFFFVESALYISNTSLQIFKNNFLKRKYFFEVLIVIKEKIISSYAHRKENIFLCSQESLCNFLLILLQHNNCYTFVFQWIFCLMRKYGLEVLNTIKYNQSWPSPANCTKKQWQDTQIPLINYSLFRFLFSTALHNQSFVPLPPYSNF